MTALKNKSFKPTLEALEDRFLPSANPWTMLAQPMLNGKAAEAAVGHMLQDVQQHLNTLQTMVATAGHTPVNQTAQGGVLVQLLSKPLGPGKVQLGGLQIIDGRFMDANGNLKAGYEMKGQFRVYDPYGRPGNWQSADFKLVRSPYIRGGYEIDVDRSAFNGKWNQFGQMVIDVQIQIVQNGNVVASGTSNVAAYAKYGFTNPSQLQANTMGQGASSTSANQTETTSVVSQMSIRDQFFVALGQKHGADGLPNLTAVDGGA